MGLKNTLIIRNPCGYRVLIEPQGFKQKLCMYSNNNKKGKKIYIKILQKTKTKKNKEKENENQHF